MIGGIISSRMARKIGAAYCCAACWSPLIIYYHVEGEYKDLYTLECEYCGTDVPGFVTRRYVERKKLDNFDEYKEAQLAMQIAYPHLFPRITPKAEKREQGNPQSPSIKMRPDNHTWFVWDELLKRAAEAGVEFEDVDRENIPYGDYLEKEKMLRFYVRQKEQLKASASKEQANQ
jgi:hypothetical protein